MTPKNVLKFAPNTGSSDPKAAWTSTSATAFEDLIFKPEFTDRILKLEIDRPIWLRLVPALEDSSNWMIKFRAYSLKHCRFIQPNGQSIFSRAYRWFADNAPDQLYNRTHPTGHRLLSDQFAACWCLVQNDEGKVHARLLLGSDYDGKGNGVPGLAYRLRLRVAHPDPDVDVILDPLEPEQGALIGIEKSKKPGSRYPIYDLRVGRRPAPIQELLDRMDPTEFSALCPIEATLRELSEDQLYDQLARVIGAETAATIRASNC